MCSDVCFVSLAVPFMGRPAFLFIVQRDEQITEKERERERRKVKGKKASWIVGPFFPFMRVPLAL